VAPVSVPEVSVVVATRDRPERLGALLRSLECQAGAPAFEVIVVDDGSGAESVAMLDAERRSAELELRVVRHEQSLGPAAARNAGWRAARGALVAFTDDDCEVDPQWLAAGYGAWSGVAQRIVQGRTEPNPAERRTAFTRTIQVLEPGPPWETCNIFFPRAMLEALDGFDERFPLPGGEDTDLAWRAVLAGADVRFEAGARAFHAVLAVGPVGMLRYAWHWHETVPLFARHPGLRRRQLHRGVFWSPVHEELFLAALAVALPRRALLLRLLLAWPYARRRFVRRSGPLLAPYLVAIDVIEVAAMVRGSLRDRVLVL
jgi:glycosyltransferase involved in cell wall biosynthesis